jgi:hypothetical protein
MYRNLSSELIFIVTNIGALTRLTVWIDLTRTRNDESGSCARNHGAIGTNIVQRPLKRNSLLRSYKGIQISCPKFYTWSRKNSSTECRDE